MLEDLRDIGRIFIPGFTLIEGIITGDGDLILWGTVDMVVYGFVCRAFRAAGSTNLFARARGRNLGGLSNREIGELGEDIARNLLRENGYRDILPIQNASGNCIDIVARTADGRWVFFEVKTSSTGRVGSLSPRQSDMSAFVEEILTDAAFGRGRYQGIDA